LAALVVEFATDLQARSASADLVRARAIMDSYADAGGPGRVDGLGSFTMPNAQRGHIAELAARLWLEADSAPDRDRLAAWAHDMTPRTGTEPRRRSLGPCKYAWSTTQPRTDGGHSRQTHSAATTKPAVNGSPLTSTPEAPAR
jgi:hypothetical protein